ncbi:hypothetical protein [Methylocystis sp. SB2]|uniref:hypothetical protein n=1 Tax=Methylocystis sp. (strain SB2) TaxID=743836 RepID=UPI0004A4A0EA|nr:hypothetical protein [Methylocystis sp. SB2]ULO25093.1 hypothetical protein LNB28_06815 [Methylocystis sp. SB2]
MSDEIELNAASTVQNGTEPTNDGVDHYVQRFNSLRKESAAGVIDIANVLTEAEGKLTKTDFASFCTEAGVAKGRSYHKKLRTIGKNASRLRPHLELLPHCWTTIYKLAQMQADNFRQLVASGTLSPKMTAKDIGKFLGTPASREGMNESSRSKDAGRRVVISFGKLDVDTKKRVAAEIFELAGGLLASNSGLDAAASDPLNIAA